MALFAAVEEQSTVFVGDDLETGDPNGDEVVGHRNPEGYGAIENQQQPQKDDEEGDQLPRECSGMQVQIDRP